MKFKKISILLISLLCMLLITPIFFACSNSNQSNVNKVVIPESRYPEEEAKLLKTVQWVEGQKNEQGECTYFYSIRNSLAHEISVDIYFVTVSTSNGESIYQNPLRLTLQEHCGGGVSFGKNVRVKDMQLRITEIHDSCEYPTERMNHTIQISFSSISTNYINNTVSFENLYDATAKIELTRSFTNSVQKSEIVEVQPLTTFKKTYSGDYSVATFTLKVLSLENSIAGKIEETKVVTHTSIGKDKWRTKITFKNIYDKTIQLSYRSSFIRLKPQEIWSEEFEYSAFFPEMIYLEFEAFINIITT